MAADKVRAYLIARELVELFLLIADRKMAVPWPWHLDLQFRVDGILRRIDADDPNIVPHKFFALGRRSRSIVA
jgi:hypothetical protein